MKQLTWEEYYDGFYDWVPSTQKSYAYLCPIMVRQTRYGRSQRSLI